MKISEILILVVQYPGFSQPYGSNLSRFWTLDPRRSTDQLIYDDSVNINGFSLVKVPV